MEKKPLGVDGTKQLFIDDHCLAELRGVRKQLNGPRKHPGNPVLTRTEPWEEVYVSLYGNVIYDEREGLFQMWYSSRFLTDGGTKKVNCVCHATSRDGIDWQRTPVNRLEYEGMGLSNAVLVGQYIGPTVFYTPDDPDPQRRYRMFVFMGPELLGVLGVTGEPERKTPFRSGYGVLFSPDGLRWTEYENNPVVQGGDISTCSYNPFTKEYVAFPKVHRADGGMFRRCVGVTASEDFITWGVHRAMADIILSADEEDDARVGERLARFRPILRYDEPSYYRADMYGMTGLHLENDLHLGFIWLFDRSAARPKEQGGNEEGPINIQLAYSRDPNPYGFWHRAADRQDFLSCGSEGDYDAGMVIMSHTIIEVGDELWFYYTGFDGGHAAAEEAERPEAVRRQLPKPRSKIPCGGPSLNLATLRRDGFVSLDAIYPAGSAVTKLLTFTGRHLELNADAENGWIRVEIVDAHGEPIAGFAKDDCVPFDTDDIRGTVRWKTGDSLAALAGKAVRFIFHMQSAKLYAFRII